MKGFTLIELLITISIIAVLSALALVSYSVVLKNSRDSKRQADLKIIQSALEQYHADQFFYPISMGAMGSSITNCTGNVTPCSISKTYLNNTPKDPSGTYEYSYVAQPIGCNNSSTKCTSYCLYAAMENLTPPNTACSNDSQRPLEVMPP